MSKKFILSLDQGTTSSRAIVFDHSGKMTGASQKEFRQIFPEPGWVEHDPMDIWNSQHRVMHDALREAGIGAGDVAAIGITNQRETAVIWDRDTGKPLCNAIVWQDRRTSGYCDELKSQGYKEMIQEKTGLVIDAYFSATKWRWMLENVPGAREKAKEGRLALGTVDSWLIWNLTAGKVHVTDVTNASRTMLYNINSLNWDDELLELFGIPRSMLPEVKSSSEVYGETAKGTLSVPVPIAGIAGDQQAATFGQMCLTPGSVKCTYGTGCFILCNTGEKPVRSGNNLVTTIAWQIGNKTTYALEGSIFIGGAVIQWLRDGLGIIKNSSDVEKLAETVDDNGGVCFVPAFTGLGAPHWDQYARGMISGLTRGATAGHIARAALESIAFQVNDVMGAMEDDAGMKIGELRVDGGAVVNDLLMQFQANLIGIPVIRPENIETTALGAAYLAGLAVNFWSSVDEIGEQWAMDRTFNSQISEEKSKALIQEWDKAVSRARSWQDS
ncbi:MAG: glycerol kinase GlpK [Bacteroidales bacterium]|nr:glycerol kinase GlpK [Bacteroidales bacterium]